VAPPRDGNELSYVSLLDAVLVCTRQLAADMLLLRTHSRLTIHFKLNFCTYRAFFVTIDKEIGDLLGYARLKRIGYKKDSMAPTNAKDEPTVVWFASHKCV
jgi:hypothetical protein